MEFYSTTGLIISGCNVHQNSCYNSFVVDQDRDNDDRLWNSIMEICDLIDQSCNVTLV